MAERSVAASEANVSAAVTRLHRQAGLAREAAHELAQLGSAAKDAALEAIARDLLARQDEIIEANGQDVARAREEQTAAFVDRLTLHAEGIEAMAEGLRQVVALLDPVGEVIQGWNRPNGLQVQKVRVPLGVVAVIYESRPNVTIDALGLCLKTGNAIILRGGSDALESNRILVTIAREAVASQGLPAEAIQLVQDTEHEVARELMRLRGQVDLLIPRGGAGLIRTVMENAAVPVVETGTGTCHIYIHRAAPREQVVPIIVNAKTQKPSVCNAVETLLVDAAVAAELLPDVARALTAKGVELRGCARTRALVPAAQEATEEDWYAEYLDLILAVRVVDGLDDAVRHINRYGSHHSEAILTSDLQAARAFLDRVDSAAVYVNASTRFTDGFEYGFGAEIGISTQKLHARGPMGLPELTSYKYVVYGDGQLRG